MTTPLPAASAITGITISDVRAFLQEYGASADQGANGAIDLAALNLRDERTFHILTLLAMEGHLEPRSFSDMNDQVLRLTQSGLSLRGSSFDWPVIQQATGRVQRLGETQMHR